MVEIIERVATIYHGTKDRLRYEPDLETAKMRKQAVLQGYGVLYTVGSMYDAVERFSQHQTPLPSWLEEIVDPDSLKTYCRRRAMYQSNPVDLEYFLERGTIGIRHEFINPIGTLLLEASKQMDRRDPIQSAKDALHWLRPSLVLEPSETLRLLSRRFYGAIGNTLVRNDNITLDGKRRYDEEKPFEIALWVKMQDFKRVDEIIRDDGTIAEPRELEQMQVVIDTLMERGAFNIEELKEALNQGLVIE